MNDVKISFIVGRLKEEAPFFFFLIMELCESKVVLLFLDFQNYRDYGIWLVYGHKLDFGIRQGEPPYQRSRLGN